jgi:transglutaminase-like putative cysteine protease
VSASRRAAPPTQHAVIPSLEEQARLSALLRGPRQGWSSVFALGVMLLVTGWVADEVRLVGVTAEGQSVTAGLPLIALLSVIVGTPLAAGALGLVRAHLLGALAGALVTLVVVASAVSPATDVMTRLHDLEAAVSAYTGNVARGGAADAVPVLLLVLGGIYWTTGQYAAFAVLRHGRAAPAIVAAGVLLIVAIGIAQQLQLVGLAVFAAASMLLVIRLNLTRQQQAWSRRHIGDVNDVSRLFMRSGSVFASIALVTALGLSTVASGAPLSNAWRALDDRVLEWSLELDRMTSGMGIAAPRSGSLFGPKAEIGSRWEDSTQLDFILAASDRQPRYLRGAIYTQFDGRAWWQTAPRSYGVAAGEGLLSASADGADLLSGARRSVTTTISSVRLDGTTLLSPAAPDFTDRSANVRTSDEGGPLLTIDFDDRVVPGSSFTATARVPVLFPEEGGVTGNELAAAGLDYPPFVIDGGYLEVVDGSIGEATEEAVRQVRRTLRPDDRADPYRLAVAVQDYLRDPRRFDYRTDIEGLCDPGEPVPECLLRTRAGFCQQYATTMVMMLRAMDVPARYVQGYLPGQRVEGGSFEVDRGSRHAWVEVYFPGIGWIQFDPTPGQRERGSAATRVEDGPELPDDGDVPEQSLVNDPEPEPSDPLDPAEPEPSEAPEALASAGTGGDADGGLFRVMAVLLALVLAAFAIAAVGLARLRHLPSAEPDLAYRGIVRLATRAGYGPRSTQTVYEYVGSLSEVVPEVRDDLTLVAQARVASAYGRRRAPGEGLPRLRSAYGRVRSALLRLFFRRRGDGRSSGPPR